MVLLKEFCFNCVRVNHRVNTLNGTFIDQQNTRKLLGTKNNGKHGQLGQIMNRKVQKGQKPWVLCMILVHNTTKEVGRPSKASLQPDPPVCPYPHPTEGTGPPSLLVFALLCCGRSPYKALTEFIWPVNNF